MKSAAKKAPVKRRKPAEPASGIPQLTDIEKAFCLLSETKSPAEAAERLGLSPKDARELVKRGTVKRYQECYRKAFLHELARVEVKRIVKLNVTREDVISGLYSLAILPVEATNGSIGGQVGAYNSISAILGLNVTEIDAQKKFKGKTQAELRNFALYGTFVAPAPETVQ